MQEYRGIHTEASSHKKHVLKCRPFRRLGFYTFYFFASVANLIMSTQLLVGVEPAGTGASTVRLGPINGLCSGLRCRWWVIIDGMAARLLKGTPNALFNG
uniref:Uncharacterized protein n=1 Tax=Ceratitis capitata TaxID=7213 RepID=W8AX45_CERCA